LVDFYPADDVEALFSPLFSDWRLKAVVIFPQKQTIIYSKPGIFKIGG
jgi:hypothetical protein